jgi:hypothetical protein
MNTMNITAIKTSTLQNLQRQYNDATTIAAKAESTYEAFVNKAALFKDLYNQATANYTTVNSQWNMLLTLKSSLLALEQTSDDCNEVADVTYNNIKNLVRKWELVVQQTLEAADAINLASDYINKRKAANTLISSDLVNDATTAAKNAANAVTLTINALTAALNTLTVASQGKNSTELTGLYIDMASSAILTPQPHPEILGVVQPPEATHKPLETTLGNLLNSATKKQQAAQKALDNANAEMANAKEQLDTANAKVVATQAALTAAQAAVAS